MQDIVATHRDARKTATEEKKKQSYYKTLNW
jgi:hypothetical protein